jgi:signal transduction histidine kinase
MKILILEDDPIIAADLKKICEKESHDAKAIFRNFEQVFSLFTEFNPHLFICDFRLTDALTSTKILEQIMVKSSVHVIFITAHYDSSTITEINRFKPDGYLIKPFRPEQVVALIRKVDQLLKKRKETVDQLGLSPVGTGENPVMRTMRTGRRAFQQEAWMLKKDGGRDPILLNTALLLDEKKQPQGALAVFTDIARQKRLEEQVAHLDKLAALGRFSSSIAHEIRNPLTGIAAGIQYLQRAGEVADSQRENIEFILTEVRRIDRLIGDLMSVVRVSDLIYGESVLDDLVRASVVSMAELATSKDVTVAIEFPPAQRVVVVDADRITQVLINVIKNAIEASQPRDTVNISISFAQETPDVLFDAVGDFAIIRVRDNGLGLTEEDKLRVFEPFFTKKSGGTGLGLYVTHSIIERHGGYIYVDSEYGVGTTFSIYLPVKQVHHGDSREVGHPTGG